MRQRGRARRRAPTRPRREGSARPEGVLRPGGGESAPGGRGAARGLAGRPVVRRTGTDHRRVAVRRGDRRRSRAARPVVPWNRGPGPEAAVLRRLGGTDVPAATLAAVDATAQYCDHPSLLMSLLPGTVRLADQDADERAGLLARQLVSIHRLPVTASRRPRPYQAWASPERVTLPAATGRPDLWRRAVDVIRREPPAHQGCFLHRDFHPGNVLFTGADGDLRISGVVDWVETSWGPADLDVAHCSTALALLHGVPAGMRFADRYADAGGTLSDGTAHLYWRLLDALGFAPDAEKVAVPWRELGRVDLTADVLTRRLEGYIEALFERYA
ncbi:MULTISPECIES: phosphotransferase family protein [unclassified Streptomyces]|uniref:phosphotransferase family protein n=1 Tax=unclassified Streptomyces TaxID=2593676 RepID=UPI003B63AA6A